MKVSRIKIGLTALVLVSSATVATVSSTSANAAASGPTYKWCSGVNIVGFPGGPQGGTFAVNVYNGMVQAAKDLGPKMKYYWSNWDPSVMTGQFKIGVVARVTPGRRTIHRGGGSVIRRAAFGAGGVHIQRQGAAH